MAGLGRRTHYRKHLADSVQFDFPEPNNSNQRIAKVSGTRGSNQFELVVAPHCSSLSSSSMPTTTTNEKHQEQQKECRKNELELDMTPQLAILPTKYRKLIWLKRNDFVICECVEDKHEEEEEKNESNENKNNSDDDDDEKQNIKTATTTTTTTTATNNNIDGGIRYMITHILYKDQIKHLYEKKLWPMHSFFAYKFANKYIQQQQQDKVHDRSLDCEEEDHENDECDENSDDNDDDGIVYAYDDDYFTNTNRIAKMKLVDDSSDEDSD